MLQLWKAVKVQVQFNLLGVLGHLVFKILFYLNLFIPLASIILF